MEDLNRPFHNLLLCKQLGDSRETCYRLGSHGYVDYPNVKSDLATGQLGRSQMSEWFDKAFGVHELLSY